MKIKAHLKIVTDFFFPENFPEKTKLSRQIELHATLRYLYSLLSLIDPSFSKWLHDEGIILPQNNGKKGIISVKLFTFFASLPQKENGLIHLSLEISTLHPEIANKFLEALEKGKKTGIEWNSRLWGWGVCYVDNFYLTKTGGEKIKTDVFKTRTPVIAGYPDENPHKRKRKFVSLKEKESFLASIKRSLYYKYLALKTVYQKLPDFSREEWDRLVTVVVIKGKPVRVMFREGKIIKGTKGYFRVKAREEELDQLVKKIACYCGMGTFTSMGWGNVVEVMKGTDEKFLKRKGVEGRKNEGLKMGLKTCYEA